MTKTTSGLLLCVVLSTVSSKHFARDMDANIGIKWDELMNRGIGVVGRSGNSGDPIRFFENCAKEHGIAALFQLQESVARAGRCFDPEDTLITDGKFNVSLACRKAGNSAECFDPVIEAFKVCTGPVGHDDLDVLKSMVAGVIDYACRNNGHYITKALGSSDVACIFHNDDLSLTFNFCLQRRAPLLNQVANNVSIFTTANCRIHADGDKCLVENFPTGKCSRELASRMLVLLKELQNVALEQTPCGSLRNPGSNAALPRVGLVFLVPLTVWYLVL